VEGLHGPAPESALAGAVIAGILLQRCIQSEACEVTNAGIGESRPQTAEPESAAGP
jgi:hypothetical protein